MMQTLEQRGLLDRAVEFLPDDMELIERRRRSQPLTRPELAVLLAYAKLSLYDELLESNVPDDPISAANSGVISPRRWSSVSPMRWTCTGCAARSSPRSFSNSIINRGGPSFAVQIEDQTGASAAKMAAAFAAVRDSYGMTGLNTEIDGLDNMVSGKLQLELYAAVQYLLRDRLVWFLRNVDLSKGSYRSSRIIATASRRSKLRSNRVLAPEASAARAARAPCSSLRACRTASPAGSPICRR